MTMTTDALEALPAPEPPSPKGNPHVLWRQILGFLFWVVLFSIPAGGLVWAVFCLALGAVTFADAWESGIYKRPNKKSFLNISPMSWGIVMALLFIVAYPAYLLSRNKLRTMRSTNAFFIATVILGAIAVILMLLSILGNFASRAT
jgi:hypothetical protein